MMFRSTQHSTHDRMSDTLFQRRPQRTGRHFMGLLSTGLVASFSAAAAGQTAQCFNDQQIAGEEEHDYFGSGVDIDGDTAIVGAVYHEVSGQFRSGAAYIYERGNDWQVPPEKLEADFPNENDYLGGGVGVSGNIAIAASHGYLNNLGGVFVFKRDPNQPVGSQWDQDTILTASDGTTDDNFSGGILDHEAVAIDGRTVVAGASAADVGTEFGAGKAYIFRESSGSWNEDQILTANADVQSGAGFGRSVAIDGRLLIVGAPFEDHAQASDAGADYVFRRDTLTGQWNLEQRITAPQPAQTDHFGFSVSVSGSHVLVGSPGADQSHVYHYTNSTWTHIDALDPSGGAPGDQFGYSVSLSGSLALVGAQTHEHPSDSTIESGAAYLYQRQPNGGSGDWVEVLQMFNDAQFAEHLDRFGEAVVIDNDEALIGSLGDEPPAHQPNGQHGAVYFFSDVPGCPF